MKKKKLRKSFDKVISKGWRCSDCNFVGTLKEIRTHKCKKVVKTIK